MTEQSWIVQHNDGWCALPPSNEPDPDAWNDPTLCGYVVTMRSGSKRGMPDCVDCLDDLAKGQDASRQVEREMLDAHHGVEPDGLRVDGSSCPCPTHTRQATP